MSSDNEKLKRKFRATSKWRKFRNYIANKYDKKDAITQKPLRKGYSVHHLCVLPGEYENLEEDRFIPLNKQMHETIHVCFKYQQSDSGFMDRLLYFVNKMIELNGNKRDLVSD